MDILANHAWPNLFRVLRGWFAVLNCTKEKRSRAACFSIIAVLVCLFAFCSSLITYRVSILLFASSIALVLILAIRSGRLLEFDLGGIVPILPWLVVVVMAVAGFIAGGGYDLAATIALASAVLLAVFSVENTRWIEPALTAFIAVLLVFAVATIACYVFPQLYAGFIKPTFYSNVPMAQDYRSGLASHYSHNGTFCTIGIILSSSLAFYDSDKRRNRRLFIFLAFVFFVALVLTTKRAHLLCGVFAVGLVYLLSNNQHRYLKAICIAVLAVLAVAVLAPLIPGLEATIERLSTTFSNSTSFEDNVNNRTYLWDYALNGLSQAPLFGHGWTSYCYHWPDGVTITHMAHNELLNLLYEAGYVGTAIVLLGCASSLLLTFHMISMVESSRFKAYLRLSLCIQIFFLSYAFTSGALFTTIPNLITYFLAIAIMASIRWDTLRQGRRRNDSCKRGLDDTDF